MSLYAVSCLRQNITSDLYKRLHKTQTSAAQCAEEGRKFVHWALLKVTMFVYINCMAKIMWTSHYHTHTFLLNILFQI